MFVYFWLMYMMTDQWSYKWIFISKIKIIQQFFEFTFIWFLRLNTIIFNELWLCFEHFPGSVYFLYNQVLWRLKYLSSFIFIHFVTICNHSTISCNFVWENIKFTKRNGNIRWKICKDKYNVYHKQIEENFSALNSLSY